eukprot:scaffold2917_cov191-Amphora_coffeaeformis.AAC.18
MKEKEFVWKSNSVNENGVGVVAVRQFFVTDHGEKWLALGGSSSAVSMGLDCTTGSSWFFALRTTGTGKYDRQFHLHFYCSSSRGDLGLSHIFRIPDIRCKFRKTIRSNIV